MALVSSIIVLIFDFFLLKEVKKDKNMLGFFEVYQEVVVGKYIFGEKVKNIQMY